MKFQIKQYMLPHDGSMPGARGHKKVVVPRGTKVYCIVYGTLIYWCTYLHMQDAIVAMHGLEGTVNGKYKRTIDLQSLLAWNFKSSIPKRVFRSEEYRK
jgi:hypothetical protein